MRYTCLKTFVVLVAVSTWACATAMSASAQSAAFKTAAKRAILLDYESNAILFEKNADELMPPASMSKLVTIAVVYRALKTGELSMEDEFVVSEHAWRTGGAPSRTTAMFVPINTRATLNELLQGIIVQSGNDAAIAIAEGLAGSEAAFAEVMTKEARRIGLHKSTFANPTGLNHPDQQMTARELAKLAVYLIQEYPEYYPMFAQKRFNYRRHRFINRNRLLFSDLGVDGLKTGYVKAAGYGVTLSAQKDGRRLIAVIGGTKSSKERWSEARRLLEWGFSGFVSHGIFDGEEIVGQARVWGGTEIYVPLVGQKPISILLPRFPSDQKLRAEVIYNTPLKPPVAKGDQVAVLRVTSSTGTINQVQLYAAQDVAVGGTMRRGLDSLFHLAFGWLP
ncbi:MAG: D-alanyl-D-alanine carboxypeptidase family protein [Hyphomicrobiaceae bacterium]